MTFDIEERLQEMRRESEVLVGWWFKSDDGGDDGKHNPNFLVAT